MANTTKCGDRRCTIEEMELELRGYESSYETRVNQTRATKIDDMDPALTRTKTEIDEAKELIASAKKRGADAWDDLKNGVVAALDRLGGTAVTSSRK